MIRKVNIKGICDDAYCPMYNYAFRDFEIDSPICPNCGIFLDFEPWHRVNDNEGYHKCSTCKHYTSGEHDGSCGSYICEHYSNWESEDE